MIKKLGKLEMLTKPHNMQGRERECVMEKGLNWNTGKVPEKDRKGWGRM